MIRTSTMAATAVVAIALLSACTSTQTAPAITETPTPTVGTLTGQALLYGGPVNPDTGEQALSGEPAVNSPVTAKNLATGEEFTTTSDSAGRFSIVVPAGTYAVCAGTDPVEVPNEGSVTADCITSVP